MSTSRTEVGSPQEQSALFASLYEQLRRIARRELRRRSGVSLSATTLLHEAYFKMKGSDAAFPDESHFLAYASRAMRTLVIDYARNRQAEKRGGAFHITRLPTEVPEALTERGAAGDEDSVEHRVALPAEWASGHRRRARVLRHRIRSALPRLRPRHRQGSLVDGTSRGVGRHAGDL